MKIIIAFDSFKDCINSIQLGESTENVIKSILKDDKELSTEVIPISDGGEGFIDSLLSGPIQLNLKYCDNITGPLGNKIRSKYAYNKESGLAVIEMATSSGLELVPLNQRNPMNTTTYGTGAGGSATNDGGLGALQAIGLNINVLDNDDGTVKTLSPTSSSSNEIFYGRDLQRIESISFPQSILDDFNSKGITFEFLTDVNNLFIGPRGAVNCFSGQKGANEQDKLILEEGMKKLSKLFPNDISMVEGVGAAGGLPAGFVSIFNATIKKGIDFVIDCCSLERKLKNDSIDLLITGEGCFDDTTLSGKVVHKVRIEIINISILCTKFIIPN
eukprot:gene867-1083_t